MVKFVPQLLKHWSFAIPKIEYYFVRYVLFEVNSTICTWVWFNYSNWVLRILIKLTDVCSCQCVWVWNQTWQKIEFDRLRETLRAAVLYLYPSSMNPSTNCRALLVSIFLINDEFQISRLGRKLTQLLLYVRVKILFLFTQVYIKVNQQATLFICWVSIKHIWKTIWYRFYFWAVSRQLPKTWKCLNISDVLKLLSVKSVLISIKYWN